MSPRFRRSQVSQGRTDSLPATRDARGTHKHGRRRVRSAFFFPTMVAFPPTTEFSFNGSNLPLETVTIFRPSGAQIIRKLDIDLKVSATRLGRVPTLVTDRAVTLRLRGIGRKQCNCGREPQHLHRDRIIPRRRTRKRQAPRCSMCPRSTPGNHNVGPHPRAQLPAQRTSSGEKRARAGSRDLDSVRKDHGREA